MKTLDNTSWQRFAKLSGPGPQKGRSTAPDVNSTDAYMNMALKEKRIDLLES
jgi:hypothetical protein